MKRPLLSIEEVRDGIESDVPVARRVDSLSRRERQVIDMATLGLTNQEIAQRLHVTVHAVKFHLNGIYRKLGVANRTEAAVVYLRATPAVPLAGAESGD